MHPSTPSKPSQVKPKQKHHLQLLLQQALHPPLHSVHILCRRNIVLPSSLATRQRQILRHDTIDINGIDTRLLEALRKRHDLRRLIQSSTLYETTRPGEDGGDRVGGCLVALLVLAVMAGDGSVGGFGLESLAVGGDEDAGHEAEGAETLGDDVGLDVAVVVWSMLALSRKPLFAQEGHREM